MSGVGLVALSLLVASAPAVAVPITLEEAVTRALTTSPEAKAANARAEIGRSEVVGADPFPINPVGVVQLIPRYNFDGRASGGGTVGLTLGLPVFGRWGEAHKVARARSVAAESRSEAEKVNLVAAVRRAYVVAQLESAQLALVENAVAAVRRLVQLSASQEAAGAGTVVDVNIWKVELGRTRSRQLQQQARYLTACATLARLTGDDGATNFMPSEALSLPRLPVVRLDEQMKRPDLEALEADVAAAAKDVSLQASRAWPDVTIGASVTTQDVSLLSAGQTGYAASTFTFSMPLAVFERNQGGVARAKANAALAEAIASGAQRDASLEVRRARWAFESSVQAAEELRITALSSSDANVRLQQQAYEAGQVDASELVLAQRTQLEVHLEHLNTIARARMVEVDLALAEGRLLLGLSRSDIEQTRAE